MKIVPLNKNILIRIKEEGLTKSGIIFTNEVKLDEADVIAVASDVEEVKVGDRVLLKHYSTDEIELGGEKLCFIKEENVLGLKK